MGTLRNLKNTMMQDEKLRPLLLRSTRREVLIDLDGDDLFGIAAKLLRQRPDAGADLQHAAGFVDARLLGDAPRHPALGQKILPLCLGKMKAMAG